MFREHTQRWFDSAFEAPTPAQTQGWPAIAGGEHTLLIAPTGSGKTLAAFLWAIDGLASTEQEPPPGVRVLYVSPLKALVYDIERNLRQPLEGLQRAAAAQGQVLHLPRVAMRTGDTTQAGRRAQAKDPASILVTTPESLFLLLTSAQRETLRSVETVIVDEVHALAPTKRGAHLALSLERLARLVKGRDPQRVGLSATARPSAEVARFLGGDRAVKVVDVSTPPALDLQVVVPLADMTRPGSSASSAPAPDDQREVERRTSVWPLIYPQLAELVRAHESTILFVNSRGLCERLCQRLNEELGAELARAHHGSLAHEEREVVEEALKEGAIKAIVATSSLELGVDMAAVDLVLLVESPHSVASGLQRVGRAGHQVGAPSKGRIFPKHRADLLEAAVVAAGMSAGAIESLRVPHNALDVLAQQIVATCAIEATRFDELLKMARRCASYAALTPELLRAVLEMLSGRYPSTAFADLRPSLIWDRDEDLISARRGAQRLAVVNAGTIPDRGHFGVFLGEDGPRVGELDEEMVHETRAGQTFTLGASTWRVQAITRDRVIVTPAPGEPGKLPFWHGDRPSRSVELGHALGRFVREVSGADRDEALARLQQRHHLDAWAAENLLRYLEQQKQATGELPSDRSIVVERFRDELGDWRVCILSPFGARVHAPWALAIEAQLAGSFELQTLYSDDGIVLRLADTDELPSLERLLPSPEALHELVVTRLDGSALFAGQFRENAARALLLPRRRPGARVPLWAQRLRAQQLLAVAREHPSFPIILETYRSCLQDVFDLPALKELLGAIARREIRVVEAETRSASPFSRSLVFAYVAAFIYEGDAPLAERRAQALALDREMLRELLGDEELRTLIDHRALDELVAELQHLAEGTRAGDAEALWDLLRRLGDLDADELAARCEGPVEEWLDSLEQQRRALPLSIAGRVRWVVSDDAALYRDAFGMTLPAGLPLALCDERPDPLREILLRYARRRGPFVVADLAARYGVTPALLEPALEALVQRGKLLSGAFSPHRSAARELCDPEVLSRIKRRSLARARSEVAPVAASTLGRFVSAWHGLDEPPQGMGRLEETLQQLEGLPLSFAALEGEILPARVAGFRPAMLDELGASGSVVWIGHGALGEHDGRVALYRRQQARHLAPPPRDDAPREGVEAQILALLANRGACFLTDLIAESGASTDQVSEALWKLAWAGHLTNDTFLPLRARAHPRRRGNSAAGGRWSLTAPLRAPAPSPTERAHAWALTLLERHGIVSREAALAEGLEGGFGAVYPVLREMASLGKIRRGYFVEGLSGAQFASAGAVERLRTLRHPSATTTRLLDATDPAQPYGALLSWPHSGEDTKGAARRVAGAHVVLVNGDLALYIERGARRLLTFFANDDTAALERVIGPLRDLARRQRGRYLRLEWIDGQRARQHARRGAWEALGFSLDYKGLVLEG